MPKEDKGVDTGVDVQIISGGASGGSINVPATAQNGNGVVVMPIPQAGTFQQPAQPGPTVIVITVGQKKEEEKKKKSSSVFQRL
jgi:hypothetical protein